MQVSPLHFCGLRKGSCLLLTFDFSPLDLLRKRLQVCYLRIRGRICVEKTARAGQGRPQSKSEPRIL